MSQRFPCLCIGSNGVGVCLYLGAQSCHELDCSSDHCVGEFQQGESYRKRQPFCIFYGMFFLHDPGILVVFVERLLALFLTRSFISPPSVLFRQIWIVSICDSIRGGSLVTRTSIVDRFAGTLPWGSGLTEICLVSRLPTPRRILVHDNAIMPVAHPRSRYATTTEATA